MATVTPSVKRGDNEQRVRHPLERLRGAIRTYVGLEGLAYFVIFLALWFWIGLLLDYGVFKAFSIDWVQEAPRSLRGVLLAALALARIGRRLGPGATSPRHDAHRHVRLHAVPCQHDLRCAQRGLYLPAGMHDRCGLRRPPRAVPRRRWPSERFPVRPPTVVRRPGSALLPPRDE